jgi:hypothetical protein
MNTAFVLLFLGSIVSGLLLMIALIKKEEPLEYKTEKSSLERSIQQYRYK